MINLKAKYTAEEIITAKFKLRLPKFVLFIIIGAVIILGGLGLIAFMMITYDENTFMFPLVGGGACIGAGFGFIRSALRFTPKARLKFNEKHNPNLLDGYQNEINIDREESILKVVVGSTSAVDKVENSVFEKILITNSFIYFFIGPNVEQIAFVSTTNKAAKEDIKALIKQFGDKVVDKRRKK